MTPVFQSQMKMVLLATLGLLLTVLCLRVEPSSAEEQEFLVMATGGVNGVYFPAGGAVCQVVNRQRASHRIRCSVEATPGSVHNLTALSVGDVNLGIVQSDIHYRAVDDGTAASLRSLMSLHREAFTVVAGKNTGIRTLSDLEGKRVNIGNPGSGQRVVMENVMALAGWTKDSFAEVSELSALDQATALCSGAVDAIVYMVGHPNASIREALRECDGMLVEVKGPVMESLLAENSFMHRAEIRYDAYGLPARTVESFGVVATLMAHQDLSEDTAYNLVRTIFENLDAIIEQHAALADLLPDAMAQDGLTARLHPGAARYYQEAGLETP